MRIVSPGLTLAALAALSSPVAAQCDYEAPREARVEASGLRSIVIDAEAGELRVVGRRGSADVEVRGTACASSRRRLEEIQVRVTRSGDVARIETEVPRGGWSLFGGSDRLDLEIDVPDSVPIEITDGSGPVEVRGVAALQLEDGSGSIRVEDVSGDVSVRDGSGGIELERIAGDVRISDGSGGIDVFDVSGSVTIEADGSGGIEVRRIRGDFLVERDGSGGVRHRDVEGRVQIPQRR